MKIRKLLVFAALVFSGVVSVNAQEGNPMMQPIPTDPAVKMGKLENGLTYYVRHNGYPEKRVNFYIAQRVGSLQEEENQRGLAALRADDAAVEHRVDVIRTALE